MGQYLHLSLPNEIIRILEEKAKENYLNRTDVARQYLMKSLMDETVVDLRKKRYSIRKIAETVHITTEKVMETLGRTGIDEELYPDEETYTPRT